MYIYLLRQVKGGCVKFEVLVSFQVIWCLDIPRFLQYIIQHLGFHCGQYEIVFWDVMP
jgi:hypothetical protein